MTGIPKGQFSMKASNLEKRCTRCGSDNQITADHIIPLAVLKAMGIPHNEKANLQALCFKCNQIKGSQLDPKNKKTVPLMKMYLDRWQDLYAVPRKQNVYVFRNLPVKSDTTTYYFGVPVKVQDLTDIYRKQRATWRQMRTG
jgi:hypothetical protein